MTIELSEYVINAIADAVVKKMQKPCEDAISRQEAIEVVRKWFDKIQINGDICLDGIISLPSVTPQPKIGQRLCRTCIYGDKNEYDKPCIIYSDKCQLYRADDILDKIRAEIESCREDEKPHLCDYRYHRNEGLDKALEIIDKYKAESEDKE